MNRVVHHFLQSHGMEHNNRVTRVEHYTRVADMEHDNRVRRTGQNFSNTGHLARKGSIFQKGATLQVIFYILI